MTSSFSFTRMHMSLSMNSSCVWLPAHVLLPAVVFVVAVMLFVAAFRLARFWRCCSCVTLSPTPQIPALVDAFRRSLSDATAPLLLILSLRARAPSLPALTACQRIPNCHFAPPPPRETPVNDDDDDDDDDDDNEMPKPAWSPSERSGALRRLRSAGIEAAPSGLPLPLFAGRPRLPLDRRTIEAVQFAKSTLS